MFRYSNNEVPVKTLLISIPVDHLSRSAVTKSFTDINSQHAYKLTESCSFSNNTYWNLDSLHIEQYALNWPSCHRTHSFILVTYTSLTAVTTQTRPLVKRSSTRSYIPPQSHSNNTSTTSSTNLIAHLLITSVTLLLPSVLRATPYIFASILPRATEATSAVRVALARRRLPTHSLL